MTQPLRSRVRELSAFGQSPWCDQLSRQMVQSGELRRLVEEDGIVGLTSNPTIFQKAMVGGSEYDQDALAMARAGLKTPAIYEALAIADIQAVADLLRPTYDRTEGLDGLVSLEVSPDLADDTTATIAEGRRLHAAVARLNVFIKVPATRPGLPAISALLAQGINVNVTLIFGLQRYREVIDAYLTGLERAAQAGHALRDLTSVASFFVSRVDTLVDKMIDQRLEQAPAEEVRQRLVALRGRAAIANARLAYEIFQGVLVDPRFQRLQERGARPQRPLWASTSTKNPAYADVMYVEQLIGPQTVNTMPLETIRAFRDHGQARPTLATDVPGAREAFAELGRLGIDMEQVAGELEVQGVKLFADSFHLLLEGLETKRVERLQAPVPGRQP